MGATPKRGWMKREFAKYPIGCLVKHDDTLHANTDKVGQITGHYIHKDYLPCAWIEYGKNDFNGFPLRILTKID